MLQRPKVLLYGRGHPGATGVDAWSKHRRGSSARGDAPRSDQRIRTDSDSGQSQHQHHRKDSDSGKAQQQQRNRKQREHGGRPSARDAGSHLDNEGRIPLDSDTGHTTRVHRKHSPNLSRNNNTADNERLDTANESDARLHFAPFSEGRAIVRVAAGGAATNFVGDEDRDGADSLSDSMKTMAL